MIQPSTTSDLKEAPGPKGDEHTRAIAEFKRDGLAFLTRMAEEYGDIVQFRLGLEKVFEVAHPDYIRYALVFGHHNYMKAHAYQSLKMFLGNALLTSEGEVHRRHRRMIQPIMHHQRMLAYAPVMSGFSARLRDRWTDGETVDINREMLKLALSIVGKCLFDVDFEESSTNELSDALSAAMHMFSRDAPAKVQMMKPHIREGMANLQRVMRELIAERRRSGEERGDLLSMLLKATDTEGNHGMLTDEEVFQHSLGLIVGGHETTGAALTWTWYMIATHREVEEKLHEEVDRVVGDRLPTPEDVERLEYTRMVFQETLRLYPSAWTVTRKSLVDHDIDGYSIPKDATVFVPQWVAHRDPRWFPEPDRFLPERWLPGLLEVHVE